MSQLNNVTVICFTKGAGISRKSGSPKPYAFAEVQYLVGAEHFINDDHNIRKYGFDIKNLGVSDSPETEARMAQLPFCHNVNLIMSADPKRPDRNIVIDWSACEEKPKSTGIKVS